MEKIRLNKVTSFPDNFEPDCLYFSEEYEIAGHFCPCGCESKIITPINSSEWSLSVTEDKPTLHPSLGNWELPCKSHYWIKNGNIIWAGAWSKHEIEEGRIDEEIRRKQYYSELNDKIVKKSILKRFIDWIKSLI